MKAQKNTETGGGKEMQRKTFKIRIWTTLAVATASLAVASSASAFNAGDASSATAAPQTLVISTSNGFSWVDAAIGAAVALAVGLAVIGLAYVARTRSRLATSH